jgi:hypothetical protein
MWALLQRPRVRVEDSDAVTVLHLTGRPRSTSLPSLDRVLPEPHDRDVVVDLGELSSLDGAAWLWVLRLEDRVRAWGRGFRLANGLGAPVPDHPRAANPSSTASTTRSANAASSSPPNIRRK